MESTSKNASTMNHPNQSSIPEHGYMKEHTPNNNMHNTNSYPHETGQYPHAIPVNNYDGNMNRHGNGYGCGNQYPYDNENQGSHRRSSLFKFGDLGCLLLLGITSLMGFCFAADFSAANDGGSSKLILSFVVHLLVLLFIVILGLEILCNKPRIVSVGGRIFISFVLFVLSLVAGSVLLAEDDLDSLCDGWYHNKRNCNDFKAAGILNIICAFFFLIYLVLQCIFQPVVSALTRFVEPNNNNHNCALQNLFRSKDGRRHSHSSTTNSNQQIQSPIHPSTQV